MGDKKLEQLVNISLDSIILEGILSVPWNFKGIVIFAHGSGSSRHSPRNNFVAGVLRGAGLGTLLFDLLTEQEDKNYETRFAIDLLTKRLLSTTHWLKNQLKRENLNLGYFGSSTGAAAALMAAAALGEKIKAVVSRGGRTDLAEPALKEVKAPTLLLVGGNDPRILEINQASYKLLSTEKELKIIPGAGHLFEEAGALEEVARLAATWFKKHLL